MVCLFIKKGGGKMVGGAGALFWLVAAVILFLIESATVQMVCIWFACGALFSMLASFAGASFVVQMVIFLVTSVAVLIIGRPLLLDKLSHRRVPTNADRVIGQTGVVVEPVDNIAQTGRVRANGLDWTARSEQGDFIPENTQVIVKYIDGVKLIVEPLREPATAVAPKNGEE